MSDEGAKIIPFPRPPLPDPPVWSDGTRQNRCGDLVHVFASVPGRCQCGERLWNTIEAAPADGGVQWRVGLPRDP